MSALLSRVRAVAGRAVMRLPESWLVRLVPGTIGYCAGDVPAPIGKPDGDVRLLIAPVNFAAQAYQWARSAERIPGVVAVNQQYRAPGDFGFPSDAVVPVAVFVRSLAWARRQAKAVLEGFTHVLVEAERPILGQAYGSDLRREVAALQAGGLQIAMVAHGSDLRLPSRHREWEEWSPFRDADWELVPILEAQVRANRELLADLGLPVFVSTPDLLQDWPRATWLPVAIDTAQRHTTDSVPLRRDRPVVVHAPSNPRIKGTYLIREGMRNLEAEGIIEYRELSGISAVQMPQAYAQADIVLDQFRLGSYGVAAVEAMAAGRLVIGHVHDFVRDHVLAASGWELPIVQATPRTIPDLLRDVVARSAHYQAIAARGPDFVHAVHNGRASADVLESFLCKENRA